MGNGWSIKLGLMGNHGVVAQLFVCCVCLIVLFSVRTSKLCTLLLLFFVEAMKYKLNWLVGWLVFGYRDTRLHEPEKCEPPELGIEQNTF
jgi:hypothetical protein